MFDYIVVGAGSAGCVLAARLSEAPGVQVLLIEAGPPDRVRDIRTPLAFPRLFQSPVDWNFWTAPQSRLNIRHLYWPRGKMLGGSGSSNAMVHVNACAADFDSWGVPGWAAENMLPLRQKIREAGMRAEPASALNPLSEAFLSACEWAGLTRAKAMEDASTPIAAPFRLNISNGRRWSAADAYLRPALHRGNLTVWTNVTVLRVVMDGKRATGIEYSRSGATRTVPATSEVILCAGTIGSPHLLMLSGIGPRVDLESRGISVVEDLPGVGANLHDRVAAPMPYFCLEPVSLSGAFTFANRWQYRLTGTGPLASNGAEVGAVFKSKTELERCDLEIVFAAAHFSDHGFAAPGGHGFSLIPALLAPQSRGRIVLASSDPSIPAVIDPAYLSEPADLTALVEGVRFARLLLAQGPFTQYRGDPVPASMIEPEEHIREWGQTLYDPVGSCRMGADAEAVVDGNLRVHGITGLRVADASIIPGIPRAPINATVLAIAERAAQLLQR